MTLEEWPTDGACDLGLGNAGPWIGRGQTGGRQGMPRSEAESGQGGAFN